ncbi:glycosyltransferase [Conexibacter sp. JD483]|uniref:glycosyltransferase n=1 Tax=unclassified Conexibacter TaxID=2627773 RepID=UPI002717C4C3|nr:MULTISPECIES: glycosyltransferase [unclassified Conexibacter]MDO8187026.1 glycosyltransferase [Conexibacter sp. CPCC 205706]MDO8200656.1 glycosyltransferase [Conexibacter sp. CPCC 205762]MDR9371608.1 glycosyltransferase [Conexibacter sp. JD483]
MSERFAIAQVTPYAWEAQHDVNRHVARVADELAARGHRVLIVAPSQSAALVRASRRAIRAAADDPAKLLEGADEGVPRLLGVGEVLPFSPSRKRAVSLPIDVARTIEQFFSIAPLDLAHIHEPFAPSAASAALRHSRALNVGSFHSTTERVLSTQVARRVVELFLGRLDARVASYEATREQLNRWFPADYRVVLPGADAPRSDHERLADDDPRGPELVLVSDEERPAVRTFVRALRRLPLDRPWRATVWTPSGLQPPGALRGELRGRVAFVGPDELDEAALLARADVVVRASAGAVPVPAGVLDAIAAGAVPVVSRLPVYEELIEEGAGLLFEPGDVETLTAQLTRLVREPQLRERLSWTRVVDELEQVYGDLVARRHDGRGDPVLRAVVARRPRIDVDLHMHTDHSGDCATPVEVLLAQAKARGLGAIAVTDHNEISGALEAQAKAEGIKVIVGEEVKTKDQGEVIGLFLRELIPRGLSLEQTIAEIKRQGGLVYVPHPFDRMHSVPDYEHLLAVLDDVDAIEVFNPRIAIHEFNEEAVRFAAKYRVPAGAGSDAHVAQGLGSVRIRMPDFDGPQEFMEALREADVIRTPASLLYVQALKFLQTKATPPPARRGVREARVRRAVRKS